MSYKDFRLLYFLLCFMLGTIIMSPTLAMFVELPRGTGFSELWILALDRMAKDYPLDVEAGSIYNVSLGASNHMGELQFYMVCVKLRNQTESPPDVATSTPSPIPSVLTYYVFLPDDGSWELPLAFSVSNVSSNDGRLSIGSLIVNGVSFVVDKPTVWDYENNGYYYQLFAELWTYNIQSKAMQFDNRFVSIWLNITDTG